MDSKFMVSGAQGTEQILDVLQRPGPAGRLVLFFGRHQGRRRHGVAFVEVHHPHARRVTTLGGDLAHRCSNEYAAG